MSAVSLVSRLRCEERDALGPARGMDICPPVGRQVTLCGIIDGKRRSDRIIPWREDSPVQKQTKTRGCGAEDFTGPPHPVP